MRPELPLIAAIADALGADLRVVRRTAQAQAGCPGADYQRLKSHHGLGDCGSGCRFQGWLE